MNSLEKLIADLDISTRQLTEQLEQVGEVDFDKRPTKNGWSPAEIAEHILVLETNVNRAMQNAHVTQRAPDLKIEPMKQGLADRNRKYTAPDFVHPAGAMKSKQVLIDSIKKQREILKGLLTTLDLTETVDFKHPYIGSMTRLEWGYFIIFHTERHMRQIDTLAKIR